MGPAQTKRRARAPTDVADFGGGQPPSLRQLADQLRRPFLDALPLPGAIVERGPTGLNIVDANSAFDAVGSGQVLGATELASRLLAFLVSGDRVIDFDWSDGDPIAGRQYSVRAARLAIVHSFGPRCLLTLLDRTAERATEKSLRREMFNDALTGLPNRAGFSDALDRALASAAAGRYAVVAIDLTRFSRINESIGSIAGDELLITVARRLVSALRAGDLLGRIGGNEFGVLVRVEQGVDEVMTAANRLASVLALPCRLSDLEIRIDCAVGCAVLEAGCDSDELIRRALFALKRAKHTNNVELYQPRAFDIARHNFSVETELRRAIEAERLSLAFQPVIDLATGQVAGFEALARWNDPDVGCPPSTFVPVAEQSGLIVPLGRWALDAALRTLKEWDARAGNATTSVAVNVSSIQLARDDVPKLVAEALARHAIDPSRLTLELTESAIVDDPDRAGRALDRIRAIGSKLALDDFGTGYSNLAYLQRLPIDMLKIDQSFVTTMLGNRDKVAIVRAILSLAEALGLDTTAEGVETEQLGLTLAALGCTRAQGYVYAPPLDEDAAYEFWVAGRGKTENPSLRA